jgi:copper chaperone CopZ
MSTYLQGVSGSQETPDPTPVDSTVQQQLRYLVAGVTCDHCRVAITEEVGAVAGVASVDVDLATKLVAVRGSGVDSDAVAGAIHEAGYDAVTA